MIDYVKEINEYNVTVLKEIFTGLQEDEPKLSQIDLADQLENYSDKHGV